MPDSQPPRGKRKKTDLVHLHALASTEPQTKVGWVAWVWPEIQEALSRGKKLREVWEALQKDGMEIPYAQFRVYISRVRKRHLRKFPPQSDQLTERTIDELPLTRSVSPEKDPGSADDPLRNVREQRARKQPSFDYDPFSTNKKLI